MAKHSASSKHLRGRKRTEWLFQAAGIAAIGTACSILLLLLVVLVSQAIPGLKQASVTLEFVATEADTQPMTAHARLVAALQKIQPEANERVARRELLGMVSLIASDEVARQWPQKVTVGQPISLELTASDALDRLIKTDENEREALLAHVHMSARQKQWAQQWLAHDMVQLHWNTRFLTHGDSREPELAGFGGAIVGSFWLLVVCLAVSFPLAVCTAIYLEEFKPVGRLVDVIEVNINNLAAVPSIVFGLLGLSLYLNMFGMPRSAPLVGGLTLALMILPTMIIATRAALKAVPPSIRDAARGLGASDLQVVIHHSLPLAMPGIMTGCILGIARAMGETAPLLMIGMVAFVVDVPRNMMDPATVMPVQIYLWANNPEVSYVQKTAAGIVVLLALLMMCNALAIWLRKRFEVRW